MAGSAKRMAETITAEERFWPLERASLAAWRRAGVLRAGTGRYAKAWSTVHVRSERHLVVVCLGGSGRVSDGKAARTLGSGQSWVVPAGGRQELRASTDWSLAWWYLDPARWSVPRTRIAEHPGAEFLGMTVVELCRETMAPAVKPIVVPQPDPRTPTEDRAWLLAALLLGEIRRLMSASGADDTTSRHEQRWREVLREFRQDPGGVWSVATLSARTGVSEPTLRRLVRGLHGSSVREVIIAERMSLARQLLRLTELGQAEIAARVGYADPFAFAKAFHRQHGYWPSQRRC